MLKFTVSFFLMVLVLFSGYAQTEVLDSADLRPPRPPKVKKELKEYIPTGIMVGADIFRIGRSIYEEGWSQQEFQVDVDLRHYRLALGFGTSDIQRLQEGFIYSNSGSYWRANAEVNFLYNSPYRSILFLGFGIGRSSFDDMLVFDTQDAFGTMQLIGSNNKASAKWLEITTGTKIRVWKGLFMGYTFRYKFSKTVKFGNLIPHDLPGYGINGSNDRDLFGFSYYVYWRFPVRRQPRVLK